MIRILAHRGASEYAPENTLAAFYMALENRANGIETDIRMSKDGCLILFHDKDLSPKTNGNGPVCEHNWQELQKLDAGSWFSEKYAAERLISLDEFLYYFSRRELFFDLELKEPVDYVKFLDLIDKYNVRDKVTVTSKIYEVLKELRSIDAGIQTGYLTGEVDEAVLLALKEINASQVCPNVNLIDKEKVSMLKELGYRVRVHKVKTKQIMIKALEMGVDGMTINFPDVLSTYLKEHKQQ